MNNIPAGLELYPYQATGVEALIGKRRFLLADFPGAGKTCMSICACNIIDATKELPIRVLVLCPKSMRITWEREVKKWSKAGTYLVKNHDRLITDDFEEMVKFNPDVLILDESHLYIKNQNTQRYRAVEKLIEKAKYTWLLTATPANKSAEDYYTTFKVLLPTMFGRWTKSRFQAYFCNKIPDKFAYSGFRYDGFRNIEELKKILGACSLRRGEEVLQDLPELTYTDLICDNKNLEKFSDSETSDIISRLELGTLSSSSYQGKMQKNAMLKIPAVLELLSTYPADKKCVIFAWHRNVVEKVHEEICLNTDRTVKYIHGDTPEAERQQYIDRFQRGDLNTLVLNIQSGGVGITLTAATSAIYVEFPYTPTHWIQSVKRVHRIGSTKPVQIIKMINEGSIDERIFGILEKRIESLEEVHAA